MTPDWTTFDLGIFLLFVGMLVHPALRRCGVTVYIGLPWYGPLLAFLFGIALSRVARMRVR